MSTARAASASQRPRKRGRRPKTYEAVLGTTSELLRTVPLADLSVAQILRAAGVGRTSFYEHFSSKDDVVVKLVLSVSAEVADGIEPMFDRGEKTIEDAFRAGLGNWMAIATAHGAVLTAAIEEWPAVPELRRVWLDLIGEVTERLAALIDEDRAAGLAPAGAPSEALAASLLWGAERSFHIAMRGHDGAITSPDAIVEPLVQLFVGTIYGRSVAPPPTR
jgi:TetR/AcrR family transcriptional regulator, ethionamide resistance regulator